MSVVQLLISVSILLGSTSSADLLGHGGADWRSSSAVYGGPSLPRSAHGREAGGGPRRPPRQAELGSMSYSPDETRALLDAHIEYRRNVTPSAADMNMITWNDELAGLARTWAERCVFEHGFPTEPRAYDGIVAQNLWMGSRVYALTDAVTAWYNEYRDYHYATASCSEDAECGHYRVMVFSGLESIGCGSATCSGDQVLTACNYGPSVPQLGVPYKAGPGCALCSSGTGWCDDKLCRTDCDAESTVCKCNLQCQNCGELDSAQCKCTCKAGWRGTDCSEPCANYKQYCDSGAYTPEACVGDADAMKDCPVTCDLCDAVTGSTAADAKCCDGKGCDARMVLDELSCECVDYLSKTTVPEPTQPNTAAPVIVSWMFVSALGGLVTFMPILIG